MLHPVSMSRHVVLAAGLLVLAAGVAGASPAPSWTSIGPDTGPISFVAVAPSSGSRVYASTPLGGVFRSDDAGATWQASNTGLTTLQVQCMSVAPDDPDTVYAGTSAGAFKSTDGGAIWAQLGSGLPPNPVTSILINPSNTATVYAAGPTGTLARSTNAGVSWTAIGGSEVAAAQPRVLTIDPTHTSTLYLGTVQKGFYRSEDGGASWTLHNDGFAGVNPAILTIAVDPTSPSRVYVGVSADVYISTDKGDHWDLYDDPNGFMTSVGAVAVDASGVAYAADQLAFYARPAGSAGWAQVSGAPSFINALSIGAAPAPPVYLAYGRTGLSSGGVARWDGDAQYSRSSPPADTISALASDPAQAGRWLAGSTVGILVNDGGGASGWQVVNCCVTGNSILGNIATAIVFDARTSGLVYASTIAGIFRSTDNGLDFTDVSTGIPATSPPTFGRSFLAQPGTRGGMFAGTSKGLYQSADGTSWGPGSADLAGRQILALTADPATSTTLWAGTDDGAYRSDDGEPIGRRRARSAASSMRSSSPSATCMPEPKTASTSARAAPTAGLPSATSGPRRTPWSCTPRPGRFRQARWPASTRAPTGRAGRRSGRDFRTRTS